MLAWTGSWEERKLLHSLASSQAINQISRLLNTLDLGCFWTSGAKKSNCTTHVVGHTLDLTFNLKCMLCDLVPEDVSNNPFFVINQSHSLCREKGLISENTWFSQKLEPNPVGHLVSSEIQIWPGCWTGFFLIPIEEKWWYDLAR